ncbi:TLD domain-containing protein 2 [Porphyridium purpureum]|uniref:Oxidation resistance protein 1 n=1 Tax=Porphyridium purpureum TaxID=35688 RepID=A0A5J4YZ23_PORPP|nr:TLD domain-containing protein 2 [Porphyridium purpureum]|eukprot:POR4395..scf208_2
MILVCCGAEWVWRKGGWSYKSVMEAQSDGNALVAEREVKRGGLEQELESARAELNMLVGQLRELAADEPHGVHPQRHVRGTLGADEVEAESLQVQLETARNSYEHTKLERDILEAELCELKQRIQNLSKRPTPGDVRRAPAVAAVNSDSLDTNLRVHSTLDRKDCAVLIDGQYRSGYLYLAGRSKLVFQPHKPASSPVMGRIELDVEKDSFKLNPVLGDLSSKDGQLWTQCGSLMAHLVVDREKAPPLDFFGFRHSLDQVHAYLRAGMEESHKADASPGEAAFPASGRVEALKSSAFGPAPLHSLSQKVEEEKDAEQGLPRTGSQTPVVRRIPMDDFAELHVAAPTNQTSHKSVDHVTHGFGASLVERIRASVIRSTGGESWLQKAPQEEAPMGKVEVSIKGQDGKSVKDATEDGEDPAEASHATDSVTVRMPMLSSASHVLRPCHFAVLRDAVPARFHESDFRLLYSTHDHGISLQTLYARAKRYSPTIVAIRDSEGAVFGCYASTEWRVESKYYGTGESFVFRTSREDADQLEIYKWTRSNSYFQYSGPDHIGMGGGGNYAFHLKSDLYDGVAGPCDTFGSPCLASAEEFTCLILEVWGFETRRVSRAPD